MENADLPPRVQRVLDEIVQAARNSLGDALRAVVLFGTAAEGKLRVTSDVNLILLLSAFERGAVDSLREPLRVAQAAVQLRPMFLLETEIEAAAVAFAPKFADIRHRRRVLYGPDPFAALAVPRAARLFELKQQLLNLTLRLRAFYALRSLREEQLATVIAEAVGPLRSSAFSLLQLEGQQADSPKEALEQVARSLGEPGWDVTLALVSQARDKQPLPPGAGARVLFRLLHLAARMRSRAEALSSDELP